VNSKESNTSNDAVNWSTRATGEKKIVGTISSNKMSEYDRQDLVLGRGAYLEQAQTRARADGLASSRVWIAHHTISVP
jgi:hypothetical protein